MKNSLPPKTSYRHPVEAGPIEGVAMGDILLQAVDLGEPDSVDDVRRVMHSLA